ncbi:hypothetical protein B8A44_09600 [Dolosigranulum pigrum]|uniref:DNA endonuclease I-HmuI-like NUMOD-like domain-containing protein n=1 Tax=Dolosigranulum pigrum TaxID=29394 RepID=A0A328KF39_9LACT|nr:hypothetical protein [Dolosigranulum pigrum]RAN61406.1 hypothetical protein B8A44_09600 [Dolosigranulum pigrum]
MNKLYFGTNYVARIDSFKLNDIHYSRIKKVGGEEELVVETSVLTESPNPELSITDETFTTTEKREDILLEGYTPKVGERQDQREDLPAREEGESAEEAQEESPQVADTSEEDQQDSAGLEDLPSTESESSQVESESPQVSEDNSAKTVYAKNSDGEYNLGKRGAFNSALIKQLDLDEDAVERVLNGEQGTHKGFTFELR